MPPAVKKPDQVVGLALIARSLERGISLAWQSRHPACFVTCSNKTIMLFPVRVIRVLLQAG